MRVVAGGPAFRLIFSRKEELRQLNNVATLETLMCAGYPAYQVLFMKANGTPYERPVMLSVIKLVMKRVFRSAAAHEEDTIPKLVIFTVDLFNSFYLATFMQRLATMTLVVVMVADIADSAIELRELYLRTQRILARLNELQKPIDNSENFLTAVRALLRNLDSLRSTIHVENRVRSCISHNLSTESRILLDKLDTYSTFGSSASFNQTSQGKTQMPPHFASVVPLPGRAVSLQLFKLGALSTSTPNTIKTAVDSTKESSRLLKSKAPNHRSTAKHQHHPAYRASVVVVASPVGFRIRDELRSNNSSYTMPTFFVLTRYLTTRTAERLDKVRRRTSTTNIASILQVSLEVLFASECLVLTEYVIIPIIYGLFILATVHLPSPQYHSEMDGVTLNNIGAMVSRMFAYALLELISFVVLVWIAKRYCGIQVLYQLAFVLETEVAFVPSKLVLWILYTLTYRVTHFGEAVTSLSNSSG